MKLVIQIGLGVFLGIAAIWCVGYGPAWMSEYFKELDDERAFAILFAHTPDTVISKCGKPVSDETVQISSTGGIRTLSYPDKYSDSNRIHVRFSFIDGSALQHPYVVDEYDVLKDASYHQRLIALPCLKQQ